MKKQLFLICASFFLSPCVTIASQSLLSFVPDDKNISVTNAKKDTLKSKNNTVEISIPTLPQTPAPVSVQKPVLQQKPQKVWTPHINEPEKAVLETPEEKKLITDLLTQEKAQETFFLNFENASLETVSNYMQNLFDIVLLPDNIVKPLMQNGGNLEGHSISFKSQRALSRDEVWSIFIRFLDMAGLVLYPISIEKSYRIVSANGANQRPLPIYFDPHLNKVPDTPEKVRFVYYVKNNSLTTLQNLATNLASSTALIEIFAELNALIVTDKGDNIHSLMRVIQELDKEMPEAMSIIRLKSTDAQTVAKLYQDLVSTENPQNRVSTQKKQPSLYFPINVRIIPEPRTNCLILLGTKSGIDKIEHFIAEYIDTDIQTPFSPLHTHQLQYAKAQDISNYLSSVLAFGQGSSAAQYGGVRDGNAYFQAVTITPDPTTNMLIIRSSDDDFKKLVEVIKALDVEQPQVAIEVLIFDVSTTISKEWGAQLHNRGQDTFTKNVNWQTSGIGSIVTDSSGGLLGNLISLATGASNPAGTTMLSIKNAAGNVWGIFRVLQKYVDTRIIANPFLVTTNKYQVSSSFGSKRQVQVAQVGANTASFGYVSANYNLSITPHINSDGLINMAINISISDFADEASSANNANTFTKQITTSVQVPDSEVVVLGGITKNTVSETVNKVPLLGDIPIIGNLFRTKSKGNVRTNLMIFISPRIINPSADYQFNAYTQSKNNEIQKALSNSSQNSIERDPINKFFFNNGGRSSDYYQDSINEFMGTNTKQSSDTPPDKTPVKKNKRRLNKRKNHDV